MYLIEATEQTRSSEVAESLGRRRVWLQECSFLNTDTAANPLQASLGFHISALKKRLLSHPFPLHHAWRLTFRASSFAVEFSCSNFSVVPSGGPVVWLSPYSHHDRSASMARVVAFNALP
jgi:hypothetical protein